MDPDASKGSRSWRRWALLGAALLAVSGGGTWIALTHKAPPVADTPDARAKPQDAAPGVSGPVAASRALSAVSAAASATPARSAPRFPGDLPPAQLAEIEKQWCSHGHAAHRQAQAAVDRAYPVAPGDTDPDNAARQARFEAKFQDPGSHARVAVQERLRTQWMQRLQQRGDPRSLAAAAYLGADTYPSERQNAGQAQLRSLAEGSRDPLIWLLWRKARPYCFKPEVCGPAQLKPWRQIEPDNLLAWLPPFMEPKALSEADWAGIAAARHARSYREDLAGLLLPLLDQEPPGLALQEGLALVNSLISSWPTEGATLPLLKACTEDRGSAGPARRTACAHAAQLLWSAAQPSHFDRSFALQMAGAGGMLDESPWRERLAFAQALTEAEVLQLLAAHFHSGWDEQGCDAQPQQRRQLKALAQGGEWAEALGTDRATRAP